MAKKKSPAQVWVNQPGWNPSVAVPVTPERAAEMADVGFVQVDPPVLDFAEPPPAEPLENPSPESGTDPEAYRLIWTPPSDPERVH